MHGHGRRTPRGARHLVPLLASAAALALLVVSCSGSSSGSGKAVAGGELTIGLAQEPQCIDPHATGQAVTSTVVRSVVDSLVRRDPDGTLRPWLATSWTVSSDQREYVFHLRTDVRFTDGRAFDAEAVRANLQHIVDPRTKSLGAASYIAPYLESVTAVDPATARVRLTRPYASLLDILSGSGFGMESPATLTGDPGALCTKIVGSGPFELAGPWQRGQGVTLRRNPAYAWGPDSAGPARLDSVRVQVMPQDAVRLGALTSGQADLITAVPAVRMSEVRRRGLQSWQIGTPGENYSYFPNTARAPFSDVRVREAFRDGVDWTTLVGKVFFGVYQPAQGPLSPSTRFAAPAAATSTGYDPARSGRLLDQAGYTGRDAQGYRTRDGQRLTVTYTMAQAAESRENQTFAEQAQAALQPLGIELRIVDLPISQVIQNAENGTYDLQATAFSGLDADVLRKLFLSGSIARPGQMGSNIPKYRNPEVDRALGEAAATGDTALRARLYTQVQQQLTRDAAVFPLYVSTSTYAAAKTVRGLAFSADGSPLLAGVSLGAG
jgi:peptide/nickel transport system substrate-binding protein